MQVAPTLPTLSCLLSFFAHLHQQLLDRCERFFCQDIGLVWLRFGTLCRNIRLVVTMDVVYRRKNPFCRGIRLVCHDLEQAWRCLTLRLWPVQGHFTLCCMSTWCTTRYTGVVVKAAHIICCTWNIATTSAISNIEIRIIRARRVITGSICPCRDDESKNKMK